MIRITSNDEHYSESKSCVKSLKVRNANTIRRRLFLFTRRTWNDFKLNRQKKSNKKTK